MDRQHASYAVEPTTDDGESADGGSVQQQLLPSPSSASSASLRSQSYKGRTRTTVVCAECKRLKLRCDRQQPCYKCVQRDTAAKCVYDLAAEGKIDVHTIHRAQLSDRNLLLGIADAIGISDEERSIVANANGWPPHAGFKFTVDPARIRERFGLESSENPAEPSFSLGSFGGQSFPIQSIPFVAFSKPPTQVIPSPVPIPISFARHSHTFHQEDHIRPSSGLPDARRMLALASCAFQVNSITIPTESTSHLRLYASSLGWEPQVAYRSGAPIPSVVTSPSASDVTEKGPARNMIRMAPKHSEIDFHDAPRPKDTLVMALAYKLFVMPGLEVFPPHKHSSTASGNSAPIPSPPQRPPLLVAPTHIKRYLPSASWRPCLWDEFESLMVTHDGMGGSGRIRWLRERIETMFEWAESTVEVNQGVSSQDADIRSVNTGSSHSSESIPSSSQPRASSTRSTRSGIDSQRVLQPPTLALLAVASAVFALGALNYECRKAHSEVEEKVSMNASGVRDGRSSGGPETSSYSTPGSEMPGTTPSNHDGTSTPQSAESYAKQRSHSLPQLPTTTNSHALHSLSRACLFAHNALDLPPSLDYLYAHMLNWTFLLHPSGSLSSTNNAGNGMAHGITGGVVCQVEKTIWRELGSCVNVARSMGLGIVDEDSSGIFGGVGQEENAEDEVMSLWEREMRRRVWWMLVLFDQNISEYMGHSPLIALDLSSCRPPSDVDDSRFDPTSASLPSAVPGGNKTTFFVLKCWLATLMAVEHQKTSRDSALSKASAESFNSRVVTWLGALPEEFQISFGETVAETVFPESDVIAAQACDLHIQANLMVIRIWYPFFVDALAHTSVQESQNVLLACASSAKAIIIASQHVHDRFKEIRPLGSGHYGFGRAIFLASTLLGNVLIAAPNVIFAKVAKMLVETVIVMLEDPILAGLPNANSDYTSPQATVLRFQLDQADTCQDRGKSGTSGKRKAAETMTNIQALRTGRQVHYTGLDAASVLGYLEFGLPPIHLKPYVVPPNIASHPWGMSSDEVTRPPGVPGSGHPGLPPQLKSLQVARKGTQASLASAPLRTATRSLPAPLPLQATTSSTSKPMSRAASVASHVAASQLAQLSHSHSTSSLEETTLAHDHLTIKNRNREKPAKSKGESLLSARSDSSEAPSDSKRLKQFDGRFSAGRSSTSRDGSTLSPSRSVPWSLAPSQPRTLEGGSQIDMPQDRVVPHYPPEHPSNSLGPFEPDVPARHPHMHPYRPASNPVVYHSDHHPNSLPSQWPGGDTVQPSLPTLPVGQNNYDALGTPDEEIIPQQQRAFNLPPVGLMHHQFQQQEAYIGYDPMSGVHIRERLVGTLYNHRAEMPPSSHAIALGDGTQTIYRRPDGETQRSPSQHHPQQEQYGQPAQSVHAQVIRPNSQDDQVQSMRYAAPQYVTHEEQQSQTPQQLAYTHQSHPQLEVQTHQYSMAPHDPPQDQDIAQHSGGLSVDQQEWVSDYQLAASDRGRTQRIPQPPSWPNQQ